MKVYILNISEWGRGYFEKACESLPEEKKAEIEKVVNSKRKIEIAAGRKLLIKALAEEGYAGDFAFKTGKQGKPYAENAPQFNLSHDGDFVVCACGKSEVGIDIVKTERFVGKASNIMFTAKEQSIVENKVVKSALLWSVKEAYSKMTGEGMAKASQNTDFSRLLNKEGFPRGEFCCDGWFYSVEMFGYILTVCTRSSEGIEFIFC